jgi:hypothetical protein
MKRSVKFHVQPFELPGRSWFLIGSLSEYNSCTEDLETDVLISGDVVSFIAEYKAGVREFGSLKIQPAAQVSVNGIPIETALPGEVPHVPERFIVVDGITGGDIEVRVTAGYGPVNVAGLNKSVLVRNNPPSRPNVTLQFWAPSAILEPR